MKSLGINTRIGVALIKAAASSLLVCALIASLPTFAYDQPWNGNREDITSPAPPPPPPCPGGECDPPDCNNTSSPVYTADGSLVWSDVDIRFPLNTTLGLKRTYNSFDYRAGLFGRGWVTAQESNIAKTYRAVTEGNPDGSPKAADEFESVPIWLASHGRRYTLEETATACSPPRNLYFTFEKLPDGGFRQVYEDSPDYSVYSDSGALLESYDSSYGSTTYYVYDSTGRLQRQWDSNGVELVFTFNDQGFVSSVVDHAGRAWQYDYDTHGRLTTVTDPDGDTIDYSYRLVDNIGYKQHLLQSVHRNAQSRVLSVAWNSIAIGSGTGPLMRVASYTDAAGFTHNYAYSAITHGGQPAVRVIKETRGHGASTVIQRKTYVANANNYRILSVTDNLKNLSESKQYNERGKLVRHVDTRGNATAYVYNEQGRVIEKIELAGSAGERKILTTYWNGTSKPAVINEYGRLEKRFEYDGDLRLTRHVQIDLTTNEERTWVYTYHPNSFDTQGNIVLGQVASVDGPLTGTTDTTTFEYDDRNLLITQQLPSNQITRYRYNAIGQREAITDPNGVATEIVYDSKNRMTAATTLERSYAYVYNPQGKLASVTDPLGRVTTLQYDDQQELVKITYPAGDYTEFSIATTAGERRITSSHYSASGALLSRTLSGQDPLTRLTAREYLESTGKLVAAMSYNTLDDLTQQTLTGAYGNAGSTTYQYFYDSEGRLTSIRDGLNGVTELGYDNTGRLVAVRDPNDGETHYLYNAWGEQVEVQSPDTGTSQFDYGPTGTLRQKVDANNTAVQYGYDTLNRLTSVDYPGAELDTTLVYDQGANAIGRLSSVTDGSGSTQYSYDEYGQIRTVANNIQGDVFTLGYTYNDAAELTQIRYPSGATLDMTRDEAGRLSAMSRTYNGATTAVLGNIQWRGSQLASYQQGNGLSTSYTYDAAGRLIGKQFGEGRALTLTLDNQSQITGVQWAGEGIEKSTAYQLDALGRLTQEGNLSRFSYDAVGNRLEEIRLADNTATDYAYEPDSNRLSVVDGQPITLDNTGNTLADAARSYEYDLSGRLSVATNPATNVVAVYRYNYLGQRVSKQMTGSTTSAVKYVFGQRGELLGEYGSSGQTLREYLYHYESGNPELVAQIEADGTVYHIHTDHLGTARFATSDEKTLIWRWQSGAFGVDNADEDPDGDGVSVTINHRFPGQYFDQETGLHYNYFRDYDPSLGRYVQSDPIGLAGGINTFAYAGGNSVNYYDPFGLAKLPNDPSGLGEGWSQDHGHRNPNGEKWDHESGTSVEWHPGQPGKRGWGGKDHWHVNGGKKHLPPGTDVPEFPGNDGGESGGQCEEDSACRTVATTVLVGGTAYIIYRCIRMIPSLAPPLWPTIPGNLMVP